MKYYAPKKNVSTQPTKALKAVEMLENKTKFSGD